jgi:hypothetical protein
MAHGWRGCVLFEQHYGKFDDRQKQLAIDLLENLIQTKRASQISKTRAYCLTPISA